MFSFNICQRFGKWLQKSHNRDYLAGYCTIDSTVNDHAANLQFCFSLSNLVLSNLSAFFISPTVDILLTFDTWYYLHHYSSMSSFFLSFLPWLGLHGEFVNLLPYNFPRDLCFFSFHVHLFLQSPELHHNLPVTDGLKSTEDFSVDPLHFRVNFKLTEISKHCHRTSSFLTVWVLFFTPSP